MRWAMERERGYNAQGADVIITRNDNGSEGSGQTRLHRHLVTIAPAMLIMINE